MGLLDRDCQKEMRKPLPRVALLARAGHRLTSSQDGQDRGGNRGAEGLPETSVPLRFGRQHGAQPTAACKLEQLLALLCG
jgi:hypothetical protein